jgi:hypothetical protein
MTFAGRHETCPTWCVTQHGELEGEEDHLHMGANLRLTYAVTAQLCATIDLNSGTADGPYVLVDSEEWTLEQARSVGHALIALADQGDDSAHR